MPRLYVCARCGERGTKKDATVVVSRHTDLAYCADVNACAQRVKRAERKAARKAAA